VADSRDVHGVAVRVRSNNGDGREQVALRAEGSSWGVLDPQRPVRVDPQRCIATVGRRERREDIIADSKTCKACVSGTSSGVHGLAKRVPACAGETGDDVDGRHRGVPIGGSKIFASTPTAL